MGMVIRALTALLLLGLATSSIAADRAVCRNEASLVKALSDEIAKLEQLRESLSQLSAGTLPSDIALDDLLGANTTAFNSEQPTSSTNVTNTQWPTQLTCTTLQDDYQSQLKDYQWLRQNLANQRQLWTDMPPPLRDALSGLWQSRQRMQVAYETLQSALTAAGFDVDLNGTPIGAVHAQQRILRIKILRLLPKIGDEKVSEQTVLDLLSLYQYTIENPLVIGQFDPQQLAQLPENVTALGLEYLAVARLDALNLRYLLNRVRGWLWQTSSVNFLQAVEMHGSLKELLRIEAHAAEFRIFEFRHNIVLELETRQRSEHPIKELMRVIFRYILGAAGMLLLAVIARRLTAPLLKLNERLSHKLKGRRSLASITRFLHGLALLAPWLAGWIGVTLLANAYIHFHIYFLLAAIPLARMYIFYGVARLAGEWLLVRVAQQAGVYLSDEQTRQLNPGIRSAALLMVLPLLSMDIISTTIGPSFLLRLAGAMVLVFIYLSSTWLLSHRRADLLNAVKSVMPEQFDHWAERLLNGPLFWLFAPLHLLILLPAFALAFCHRLLIDFGWYRKLAARLFKMRVGAKEDANEDDGNAVRVSEEYSGWFVDVLDDRELPYIESGLLTALRKPVDRWLMEKSEENSLLLTGERGLGKSSALHKLKESLGEENPELNVFYCSVPSKTCSPESVLELIGRQLGTDISSGPGALVHSDQERQPTVLILDNAQNFFLSNVGCLNGWKTLLELTNARINHVFWIISINSQSWAYLSNVFGRDYQFSKVLKAKPWAQNDIRSLILSRNHLSGFKLQYDDILLSTRGPDAGNIRNAEQRFFSLLWDACHGNPMLALRLWLTSVQTAGRIATVGLPAEPMTASAEKLSGNLLFVYAAILIHENLNTEELVAATALPESVVRYALKAAFDAGFLQRSDDSRYRVVPMWYHAIATLLARKNLLHE